MRAKFKNTNDYMIEQKRRRNRKRRRAFFTLTFLLIIVLSTLFITYKIKEKAKLNIKLSETQIMNYINISDKLCEGKVQLNWKEIAAITGAMQDNDFKKVTDDEIKEVSSKFIEYNKDKNVYKLKDFNEVLKELSVESKVINLADKNISAMEKIGLSAANTKEGKEKKEFLNDLIPEAMDIYKNNKILPSVVLSQAILESGWGKSELSKKSNNLFGIKWDKTFKGDKVLMETKENYNDKIKDYFRAYKSKEESLSDYANFLTQNPRYKKSGVFNARTYSQQIQALEDSGYSTIADEKGNLVYADKLKTIIIQNDLQIIDWKVLKD